MKTVSECLVHHCMSSSWPLHDASVRKHKIATKTAY